MAAPSSGTAGRSADVAIIGLGSAGEALAGRLRDAGRSVVGFEPGLVGGECPFTACMPSKALLHQAHRPGARSADAWRLAIDHRDRVANHRDDAEHATDLVERGLVLVRERAALAGPRQVVADGTIWTVDHVIIATGSAPSLPPIPGLDQIDYWTSEDALTSSERPERIVIVGAGPIGCELGDVYRSFGSRVTLLEAGDRLLPDHDAEVAEHYASAIGTAGLELRLSADVVSVARIAGTASATIHLRDGTMLTADRVLIAAGQSPRLGDVGLDALGLSTDEVPELDESFAVSGHPWLRLIGDLNGRSPWTHGANVEAAIVAASILGGPAPMADPVMPHAVFTDPPAAHVGRSVDAHEAEGRQTIRGVGRVDDIARHATDRLDRGMAVLTIDAETGVVVGGSIVGPLADELIAIVTAWVHLEATIEQAASQVFAFPTIAQILEVAAADARTQWRASHPA